jgi:S-adenosylmethionine:tRNA ribosyltransferase-isomerase
MLLSDFDYDLRPELIAQEPLSNRDRSKLLLLNRATGETAHRHFFDLPEYLRPDDLLVLNDTRVTAVRLHGRKPTGGLVEALLIHNLGGNRWDAVVKPGRRVNLGHTILFDDLGISAEVVGRSDGGCRILDFGDDPGVCEAIERAGEVPLPPYISTVLRDKDRYQTVYAAEPGSAAAPTAGFHFTPELLAKIRSMGVRTAFVTLHVGIATFRPVRTEEIEDHVMHYEHISISPEVAEVINSAPGRIISVGTTTARVLESAAVGKRRVEPIDRETNLFVKPGYEFQIMDGLITNFHMPKSTLMVLVSTFAGRDSIMSAYKKAAENQYRFLSFGDAMFII